jgi:hypothetical protein
VPDIGPSPVAGVGGVPGQGVAVADPSPEATESVPGAPAAAIAGAVSASSPPAAGAWLAPADAMTRDASDRWLVAASADGAAAVPAGALAAARTVADAWSPGALALTGVPAADVVGAGALAGAWLAAEPAAVATPTVVPAAEWPAAMTLGRTVETGLVTPVTARVSAVTPVTVRVTGAVTPAAVRVTGAMTPATFRVTEVAAALPVAETWSRVVDNRPTPPAAVRVTDDAAFPSEATWLSAEVALTPTEDVVAFAAEVTWLSADVASVPAEEAVPATAEPTARPAEAGGAAVGDTGPALPGEPPVTPIVAADPVDVTVELTAAFADRGEPTAAAPAVDTGYVTAEVAA